MSRIQILRALVNDRLTAAVEDVCGVFERTIAEYEEEASRLKEVNSRQQKLLDAILKPQIQLDRTDPQQLFVCKEEVPLEQQEWSPSLGQEEPEPPHIKEEQEDLIQGLEEAEVLTLTLLPEKSENNEEEQSSQLNPTQTEENREAWCPVSNATEQNRTEHDGENCGVSEPASNLDPAGGLEPTSDGQLLSSDCCESETEDSDDDWKKTREPQSDLNTKTQRVEEQSLSVSNKLRRSIEQSNELKPSKQIPSLAGCKVCGKSFPRNNSLMCHVIVHSRDCGLCGAHLEPRESLKLHFEAHRTCNVCSKKCRSITALEQHMTFHTRQKPFSCTDCGKRFSQNRYLKRHMIIHTAEKPFSCTVCEKGFSQKYDLKEHMMNHTGDKPFSCVVCEKLFNRKQSLKVHMRSHTGEKPFCCTVCEKGFSQKGHLKKHMITHTGEKPVSCIVCEKRFSQNHYLKVHMRSHTGEKPFRCTVCEKGFSQKCDLKKHMITHTGEKPFSCTVCEKRFYRKYHLKEHMITHTAE
ncbi:uncharacterized protein ACJ7VT_001918 [Polymixia lowei]